MSSFDIRQQHVAEVANCRLRHEVEQATGKAGMLMAVESLRL